ncbi:phosphoribomutase [[Candida] railenensis]|uniref:Phosphoribomutase n=1 Tax=[Candida] railenensis TaxID=45579 RepID=A0A9P0VYX2_9ASCO|nr:phosphoribomutase [[Candida] railenensis]
MSLECLVNSWLEVDINPKTRSEIEQLSRDGSTKKLTEKLSKRISFGTAGLRSEMTSGFAHMNDVTVLQASQGLVQYINDNWKTESRGECPSIVVGHDHRHHSKRFAELAASAALYKGFKVYYLGSTEDLSSDSIDLSATKADFKVATSAADGVCHTPMVPFSIDYYGASCGVMVTASHNPAKDNGYKVYYGNGCQIIPPHDEGIAHAIDQNLAPWGKGSENSVYDVVGQFSRGLASGKLLSVYKEATDRYVANVGESIISKKLDFDFVYTPVHGVGLSIFEKVFALFEGGEYISVPDQSNPDPDFPTVSFPNPEEKGALDLAIKEADSRANCNLVVANDPDADRFSVAVRTKTGNWQQLTGNEIGFLFAMWIIEEQEKRDPDSLKNVYLVDSTVSSQILKSMADHHGFKFQDTLTGFKWIGNKAIDLKNEGYLVPFGYEEAIGYMFSSVNDKDGIAAAAIWLQLYQEWFSSTTKYTSPLDKLEEGYQRYGYFKECNGYYKLDDLSKTDYIFNEVIRKSYDSHAPDNIGAEFKVNYWRDLTVGYESGTKNNVPILPSDPKAQMITSVLKPTNGTDDEYVRFTCRGSGTEPKLKVYIEAKAQSGDRSVELARLCWDVLKREWFKPVENGLQEVV